MNQEFVALPLRRLADAALDRARRPGVRHAAVQVIRTRHGHLLLRNGSTTATADTERTALSVRVLTDRGHGFAATSELTAEAAATTAEHAWQVARACQPLGGGVVFADEPVHADALWCSAYQVNPFDVPEPERAAVLAGWSRDLLAAPHVSSVLAKLTAVQENRFYADLAGTTTTQQRVRVHPQVLAAGEHPRTGAVATLRSLGPPTARGWEYLGGTGWDWAGEIAAMPEHLAAKLAARPVRPGNYDLVLDASNLWLTVHETVGHATELDRALGHEMSYAGTTFATPELRGRLRYGSELMTVTADRTAPHGMATVGFDDEGVAAQSWPLIERGVLTGFQTDRSTAAAIGATRSTGCAFAESSSHVPLPRMPNVSLQPSPLPCNTQDLIAGVADGLYLAGSASWSIDSRRENFQFTAQRCHRIRAGRLAEPVSGAAYQSSTTDFWRSLAGLGDASTVTSFGADFCGKGRPAQAAAASHAVPSALFHGVSVLHVGGAT
ncbi:TldD/PmbA family protein [Goodfellowiella coeruleoviolacea]|uniref:TldD protein n=1 Tax=Goodfellowiella coeruleoviolacea TaxID=334858 RepID=A0AAE3KIT9_9PSEU|nr:TldD/PmbA family protein [Goodfellowiella coeruleoviolacea]MCP2167749.1 TldD protein [Goodfellowiella coeruleoviolacea]